MLSCLARRRLVSEERVLDADNSYAALSKCVHSETELLLLGGDGHRAMWNKQVADVGRFILELALGLLRADCLFCERYSRRLQTSFPENLSFPFYDACLIDR